MVTCVRSTEARMCSRRLRTILVDLPVNIVLQGLGRAKGPTSLSRAVQREFAAAIRISSGSSNQEDRSTIPFVFSRGDKFGRALTAPF